jgi:uncharacterized protein
MNHGLPAATVAKIHGVLLRHAEIERAILYGSRARGNFKPGSDIHLTLAGSGLGHDDLLKIMGELDDLLLPYTIDLSLLADLTHPELIDHISRVGVVFYERKPVEMKR